MSASTGFSQILIHNNYGQTNGIQLEFFLHKLYSGKTAPD